MLTILAIIANAFGRRIAGGLLQQWVGPIGGSHVGRLVMGAIAGATVTAFAPVWWWGLAAIPAVWAGSTFGFPRCGMVPKNAFDVGALAVRHGLLAVLPLAVLLGALAGPVAALPVVVAGLLRGPCYWLATLWQPYVPVLGLNPDGLPDPPAIAEFYSGGLLGLAIVVALVV